MNNKLIIIILAISFILRLLLLDKYPIGLNADEAAIGYNAYSLLQTGKDEHGTSWPLVFRSFDDYKPPLYFYLVLPFVYLFGLNEWSVRLPSALLGIASVYLIYLLAKRLFNTTKSIILSDFNFGPAEVAALFLAISPWSIHFSRGGWEVNVATFFILSGVFFFVSKSYPLSMLSFVTSVYTYHSARIISPLLVAALTIIFFRQIRWKSLVINGTIGAILVVPIIFQMFSGSGTSRFNGVSIFADPGPLAWVHEMRRISPQPNSFITKIKYNRYTAYTGKFISNYITHFSSQFLFVKGDAIDRNRTVGVGQLSYLLAPFLLIGLFTIFSNLNKKPYQLILAWLAIAPTAAALTFQSPHALRAQNMIIPLSLVAAIGFIVTIMSLKKLAVPIITICLLVLSLETGRYLYQYFIVTPRQLPISWQYGFKPLAAYLSKHQSKYDQIVITTRYDQPYILTAFYTQYPPSRLQSELIMSAKDNFGFSTGLSFSKYSFRPINYSQDQKLSNALLVIADEPVDEAKVFERFNFDGSNPTLKLIKTTP